MRKMLRFLSFTAISIVLILSVSVAVFAQYGEPVGDLGAFITESRTTATTPEGRIGFVIPGTVRLTSNLLRAADAGPLAEGTYRQMDLVEDQRFLIMYGRLPVIANSLAVFALEGTDNDVIIRVAPRGGVYVRLPIAGIPSGSYYVTVNGIRFAIVNAP